MKLSRLGLEGFGYNIRAILYTIGAIFSVETTVGARRAREGADEVLRAVAGQPFGQILLLSLAGVLAVYVIWELAGLLFYFRRDALQKVLGGMAALVHGLLLLGVIRILLMHLPGQPPIDAEEQLLSYSLFATEWGQALGLSAGVALVLASVHQFDGAHTCSFLRRSPPGREEPDDVIARYQWICGLGRVALFGRGVVFLIVGLFILEAVAEAILGRNGGIVRPFLEGARRPAGQVLLGIVAAGLALYGLFCFSAARPKNLEVQSEVRLG